MEPNFLKSTSGGLLSFFLFFSLERVFFKSRFLKCFFGKAATSSSFSSSSAFLAS
jgi:hypothetical protein